MELGGKPKCLPLNFGYHDVMSTAPALSMYFSDNFLTISVTSTSSSHFGTVRSRYLHLMGLVRITSWYPDFNGSHFGLPPSEIHRMTGLPPKIV